jgi:hypothetical protein
MAEGALLGPAAIAQLQKLIREHTRRMRNAESQRKQYGGVRDSRRIAVLQSDLLAAVDWMRDPSTALAKLARKKAGSSDYILTDEEVTVVNRFENISLDSGTVLGIEWIDGEWQPYKADCSPESGSMSIYDAGSFESAEGSDFFVPDLGGPSI